MCTCFTPLHFNDSSPTSHANNSSRYEQFYPKAEGGAAGSKSFARVVNNRHFDRLQKLLDGTEGEVVVGGETNAATKYISPTIVKNVPMNDPLMEGYVPLIFLLVGFDKSSFALASYSGRFSPSFLWMYVLVFLGSSMRTNG